MQLQTFEPGQNFDTKSWFWCDIQSKLVKISLLILIFDFVFNEPIHALANSEEDGNRNHEHTENPLHETLKTI